MAIWRIISLDDLPIAFTEQLDKLAQIEAHESEKAVTSGVG